MLCLIIEKELKVFLIMFGNIYHGSEDRNLRLRVRFEVDTIRKPVDYKRKHFSHFRFQK